MPKTITCVLTLTVPDHWAADGAHIASRPDPPLRVGDLILVDDDTMMQDSISGWSGAGISGVRFFNSFPSFEALLQGDPSPAP